MLCPVCKTQELVMTERQGIEIDYCPACRGIWLDRGELDKIIERTLRYEGAGNGADRGWPAGATHDGWARQGHDSHHSEHHHSKHYGHRRSFWKELFD